MVRWTGFRIYLCKHMESLVLEIAPKNAVCNFITTKFSNRNCITVILRKYKRMFLLSSRMYHHMSV